MDAVIARTAVVFRTTFCVLAPVAAVADGPVAAAKLPSVAALAVVLVWGWVVWLVCRRERRLPTWLVLLDAALFVTFAIGNDLLVPAHLIGDGSTWVVAGLSTTVLLASWALRPWAGLFVMVAAAASYIGGIAVAGAPVAAHVWQPAVLLIQLVLGMVILQHMRRTASATDQALEQLDEAERGKRVTDARAAAARDREFALHDDVLATLTVIARGEPSGSDRSLHARAMAALTGLTKPPDSDAEETIVTTDLASEVGDDALTHGISLRSRVDPVSLPEPVGMAILGALREGLRNIERHARTDDAALDVRATSDSITVTLTDHGIGFAPANAGRQSFGLRSSIGKRMASVGGSGVAVSAPGGGTTVTLVWAPRALDGLGEPAGPDPFGPLLTDAYATGFARALTFVPVIWHATTLVPLLTNLDGYRSPPAAIGAWLALTGIAGALAVRRGRSFGPRPEAMMLAATVAAAAIAVAMCQGGDLIGVANWAVGDFGWFLVAVTVQGHPRRVFAIWPIVPLVNALVIGLTVEHPAPTLGHLLNILFFTGYFQVGALAMYRILQSHGATATEALLQAHEIGAEQAAREAVAADRAARFRNLESSLLPLVRGLVDGTHDPTDARVQRDAWVRASMLRALLEHDQVGLSARTIERVAALAIAAADRGVAATMQLADIEALPDDVADTLIAVMRTAIDSAEPGEARLTLFAADASAARAMVCLSTSAAPADLHQAITGTTPMPLRVDAVQLPAGMVWLEAQWSR